MFPQTSARLLQGMKAADLHLGSKTVTQSRTFALNFNPDVSQREGQLRHSKGNVSLKTHYATVPQDWVHNRRLAHFPFFLKTECINVRVPWPVLPCLMLLLKRGLLSGPKMLAKKQ